MYVYAQTTALLAIYIFRATNRTSSCLLVPVVVRLITKLYIFSY